MVPPARPVPLVPYGTTEAGTHRGTTGLDDEADGFDAAMRVFFASALRVARAVLSALEVRLEAPAGWFEATYGPLEDHAQWHVKRFVPGEASPHAVTADGDIARSSNQGAVEPGGCRRCWVPSGLALLSHAVTCCHMRMHRQCLASSCCCPDPDY